MKTTYSARWTIGIQMISFLLAVVAVAVIGLEVGHSLVSNLGCTTASLAVGPQAPNVGLPEFIAAIR